MCIIENFHYYYIYKNVFSIIEFIKINQNSSKFIKINQNSSKLIKIDFGKYSTSSTPHKVNYIPIHHYKFTTKHHYKNTTKNH